jgi:hypothetical protein
MDANSVSVREHTKGDMGSRTLAEIIDLFTDLLVNKK